MRSKGKSFLGEKRKRSKSFDKSDKDVSKDKILKYHSFWSGDYLISNKSSTAFQIKHISNFKQFKNIISHLDYPSYTTDKNFLTKYECYNMINNPNKYNKNINYSFNYKDMNPKKIFLIDNMRDFLDDTKKLKNAGNFIFSNLFIEEEIFKNIHNFSNHYYRKCSLIKFCPDYKLHFPNNNDDIFYEINNKKKYKRLFRAFYYRLKTGGIAHFYSPKGQGKSILLRSILINHCDIRDKDRYTPLMIFDIKLLNYLLNNNKNIKQILIHDAYSLFKERKFAYDLIQKINLSQNIINIIFDIIKAVIEDVEIFGEDSKRMKLFVLDGYSSEYDQQNILKNIIELAREKSDSVNQKFFVYIVHDIKNYIDAEYLYKNIIPKNEINSNSQLFETYYYIENLKKISELKNKLEKDKIPEKYSEIFGENVSFFFEYKMDEDMLFDDFVKKKKIEIKNEICEFYKGDNNKSKYYLGTINEYIKEEKVFSYDEILKYVPANYIQIIMEPKYEPTPFGEHKVYKKPYRNYSLRYSFPLIKDIIKDILSDRYFINMKDPQFFKLPSDIIRINFDYEILKILDGLMENKTFFGHEKKIKIYVENIIEKNTGHIYTQKDVLSKINKNRYVIGEKSYCDSIKFNDYTCIGVFQHNPSGKDFDVLFFIREKEQKEFDMHLIKIKVSEIYIENEDELIYQVAYAKEKYKYLLKIDINHAYVSYLNNYKLPSNFVKINKNKSFLYDVEKEEFVDFKGNKYEEFPILKYAIINPIELNLLIDKAINAINISYDGLIKLIQKKKNLSIFDTENDEEIYKKLCENEVYISASPSNFSCYYKLKNIYGCYGESGKDIHDKEFKGLFDILYYNN